MTESKRVTPAPRLPSGGGEGGAAPAREFPPLERVRQDLRVKWYRYPIEPAKLRELMQRSDLQGAYQTLGHLGLWATCGAATAWFF